MEHIRDVFVIIWNEVGRV